MSIFINKVFIYISFDVWCRFKISSAATKFRSHRCNPCKANSWCIFNGFVFLFGVPAKYFSVLKGSAMLWVIMVFLPTKSLFEGWHVRFWCISGRLPPPKASGSVPEILWTRMMWHIAQGWDFLLADRSGVGNAHDRVTGKTEVENTSGYIWRLVEVTEISPKSKQRYRYYKYTNKEMKTEEQTEPWHKVEKRTGHLTC